MPAPRSTTFQQLQRSRNASATGVLLAAVDARLAELAGCENAEELATLARQGGGDQAAVALARRRDRHGHRELLHRWPRLPDLWKREIAEDPHVFATSIEEMLREPLDSLLPNMLRASEEIDAFETMSSLVRNLEAADSQQRQALAHAALVLTGNLRAQLDATHRRRHRDPSRMVTFVSGALERGVERFDRHGAVEIVEAFLLLARPDHPLLRHLISSQSAAADAVRALLASSCRREVIQLLLDLVADTRVPRRILSVLAQRRDLSLLRQLAHRQQEQPLPESRLELLEELTWLNDSAWHQLTDREQAALLDLVSQTAVNASLRETVLLDRAQHGGPKVRRAAAAKLADLKSSQTQDQLLEMLDDSDPHVQVAAIAGLTVIAEPRVMSRLLAKLDSPVAIVRQAAQQRLPQYQLESYLEMVDRLSPTTRRKLAPLVTKADPDVAEKLRRWLSSASRMDRTRALRAAVSLQMVDAVDDLVRQQLQEPDELLRVEAARALGNHRTVENVIRLEQALRDPSTAVREAALAALHIAPQAAAEPPQVNETSPQV